MEEFVIRKVYVSVALTQQKTYGGKIPKGRQHTGLNGRFLTSEHATVVFKPIQLVRPAGALALLNLLASERVKAYY